MRRKKLWKKAIALASVATMLASSTTAFAAVSSTGNSAIEYENTDGNAVINCVLPTINAGTYDFALDIKGGVLNSYDKKYKTGHNVYFLSEETAEKIEPNETAGKFFLKEREVDTGAATFLAELVTQEPASISFTEEGKYWVWQPDPSKKDVGAGMWTEITGENVADFVDFGTLDGSGKIQASNDDPDGNASTNDAIKGVELKELTSGSVITDGSIYIMQTNDITADADKLKEYVTIGDVDGVLGATEIKEGLLYDNAGAEANATDATTENVKYTKPEMQYTGTSAKAKVVNKSSVPVAVSVNVLLDNADGLTMAAKTAVGAEKAKASMYIGLSDGTNPAVAVAKDTKTQNIKATMYQILDATDDTTLTKYQSTEINQFTGGHVYYAYAGPVPTYDEMDFTIEAQISADASDAAKPAVFNAWEKYVGEFEAGTYVKPSINVVYDFEAVKADTATAGKFIGTSGASYVLNTPADGKGLVKTYTPPKDTAPTGFGVASKTFSKANAQDVEYTLGLGTGSTAITSVDQLLVVANPGDGVEGINASTTTTLEVGSNYVYDASSKKLAIKKEFLSAVPNGKYTIGLMINNNESYVYWTVIDIQ